MASIRSHITTLLLIASLIPYPANACLWTTGTSIHGGRVSTGYDMHFRDLKRSLDESPQKHLEHLHATRRLQPGDDFPEQEAAGVREVLYTFGDLEGRYNVVESGLRLLELSGSYGIQDQAALAAKISHFKWLIRWRMAWQTMLFGGLPILLLYFAYRKKWFFLSRKAEQEHRLGKLHRRTSL